MLSYAFLRTARGLGRLGGATSVSGGRPTGMFTVCPKCALTLVVTAGDLRVAQGYVRCGRCSNVFNALARLSEDRNAAANAASQSSAASGSTGVHPRTTQSASPSGAPSESPGQPPPQAPATHTSTPAAHAQPSATPRPPQPTASYTYTRPPEMP